VVLCTSDTVYVNEMGVIMLIASVCLSVCLCVFCGRYLGLDSSLLFCFICEENISVILKLSVSSCYQ